MTLYLNLAELLGAPEQAVHCIHMEGSGCYGHNGADDVAADAAQIAGEKKDKAGASGRWAAP